MTDWTAGLVVALLCLREAFGALLVVPVVLIGWLLVTCCPWVGWT